VGVVNRVLRGRLAVASVLLAGCGTTDPIFCTEQFVFGITVEVRDGLTGVARADGATLTLRDGDYVESTSDSFDGLTMWGAGERAGTYTVTVARNGYHTWVSTGVVVTADECHVLPISLRADLEAIP